MKLFSYKHNGTSKEQLITPLNDLPKEAGIFVSNDVNQINMVKGMALIEGFEITTYLFPSMTEQELKEFITFYLPIRLRRFICSDNKLLLLDIKSLFKELTNRHMRMKDSSVFSFLDSKPMNFN